MKNILVFLGENHLYLGLVSFCLWSLAYYFTSTLIHNISITKPLTKLAKIQIIEALISAIQGFVCGGTGVFAVLWCEHDVMQAKYEPLVHYCTIGTGYFMYDLIAMYYANVLILREKGKAGSFLKNFKFYVYTNVLMIAHHIILTAVLFPALITYSGMGHYFAGCFFCMELSSPFVNFRIVLSRLGLKTSKLYVYNGVMMTTLFAIFRILVFAYMYIHYSFQISTIQHISVFEAFLTIPTVCHIYCLLILSPQVYWFSMMLNGVVSVLAKKPKALDKYD